MSVYHPKKTPASNALTDLIRAVLRLSGHTHKIGTKLTRDMGLTSARWMTLGELAASGNLLTVSALARRMGLTRQSVQRLVDGLAREGLIKLKANPQDQRAGLIVLTRRGKIIYRQALEREWQWTNRMAQGFTAAELHQVVSTLDAVAKQMEREE